MGRVARGTEAGESLGIRRAGAALIALALAGSPARAQRVELDVGAGMAFPAGRLGTHRWNGPVGHLGLALSPRGRTSVRFAAEWARFSGVAPRAGLGSAAGDLHLTSGTVSFLVGPPRGTLAPYVLIGAAIQSMDIEGSFNPYDAILGVRAGGGLRLLTRPMTVRLEVTPHAVLSDYGTGRDFTLGTYWPVTVRLPF